MAEHEKGRKPVMPALETVDAAKRETLKRLAIGTAYAVPVVASFSIDGLMVNPAAAQWSNQTTS